MAEIRRDPLIYNQPLTSRNTPIAAISERARVEPGQDREPDRSVWDRRQSM